MDERLWIPALLLVVWAGWLDWRSRRIPNWLTVPALLLGLGVNTVIMGWDGTKIALGGAGLALGLLLPFVLLRGLGAGDWKLMGALGAWLGPRETLFVLLATILIAGIVAFLLITWHRRWKVTLGNLRELMLGFFVSGLRPHTVVSLSNPGLLTVPFGTAAAVATSLCYLSARI